MLSYLLKIFALLLFSFFILFNYYFIFPGHTENFDGYFSYFIFIGIIYCIYKYFQFDNSKEKAIISLKTIVGFFLINLFILCIYFFSLSDTGNVFIYGVKLFFKIIYYSIIPITIFLISASFGKKILSKLDDKSIFGKNIYGFLELTIGFICFISLVVLFGIFGLYNIFIVIGILIFFLLYSYKDFLSIINNLLELKYNFDIKEGNYLKLLSTEFFTLFSFIVLGVGLISIVRPVPIGWDDLGVYMNHPHLMAQAGDILSLGSMYSWQTFTGIGYMLGSPVYAFFINISGLFLSFFVLNSVFSNLIKSNDNNKKYFLDLPIILSTIFISLPMVGFQTIKDLKVDEGLFFISVVGLYFLYKYYLLIKDKVKIPIIYIFIIGVIAGFLFSIKFTALLFIISAIGIISYSRIGFLGFLAYMSLFFGIFTIADLWRMMNVLVNPNSIAGFENIFGFSTIIFSFILFIYIFLKDKNNLLKFIKEFFIFIIGVIVILLPWIGKNIGESYPKISISTIISGKSDTFNVDFSKIYEKEELSEIKKEKSLERKKDNTITTNEDFLRYFGYEKGINDFVYMPWNLTMQVNQKGEYTDIGFLFLALIPLIFIFLPYKNRFLPFFFIFFSLLQFLFYYNGEKNVINNSDFSYLEKSVSDSIFIKNDTVFKNIDNKINIFDIDIENYIDDKVIYSSLNQDDIDLKTKQYINNLIGENQNNKKLIETISNDYEKYYNTILEKEFLNLKELVHNNFYGDLKDKVIDLSIGRDFSFMENQLSDNDFLLIKELNNIYYTTSFFGLSDIVTLNNILDKSNLSIEEKSKINNLWKENRNIKGKIIDFFAKIDLPYGYLYILLFFLVPTLFLIYGLKNNKFTYLFKINLLFSFLYVFLWLISAFGIVWYGITMYFSFLLMIGLGGFYIITYKNDISDKDLYFKLLGVISFLLIILIYFFNSLFPYVFNNLKNSGNIDFKIGLINQSESIFLYNNDYKNILFNLNIDKSKHKEFIEKYIDPNIYSQISKFGVLDITTVIDLLDKFKVQDTTRLQATRSLNNIYKNILNPNDYFKNKEKIYRVGTFLKYYISENNNRLYEDSLIFSFNDYIYNDDSNITISRFKELGIKYMLVDLNAATIDKSDTHDLTNRYEKLLKTFTNDNLNLIETDSICLKVALENYKQNNDINQYINISGINYESYDSSNNVIYRSEKKAICVKFINDLLDNNMVNEKNYSFLLPYKYYFEKNEKTLEKLDSLIILPYKALFEIK